MLMLYIDYQMERYIGYVFSFWDDFGRFWKLSWFDIDDCVFICMGQVISGTNPAYWVSGNK